MGDLERFIPSPRLMQIDRIDVGAPLARTWEYVRRYDFASSPVVRALFWLRTAPDRALRHATAPNAMRIDDMTGEGQGFRRLAERAGESIAVGAIGKVWQPGIEFADVAPSDFAAFDEADWVKVAWELRCVPRGELVTRIVFELRVSATNAEAWRRFQNYFAIVGPFSHFIRRHLLQRVRRELGSPRQAEKHAHLAGDDLIPDAAAEMTDGVTIQARPDAIWPWLVQMGCRRAGWYSIDALDNAGARSADTVNAQLQQLRVGDVIPATPQGDSGFEVLVLDRPRAFVLGGLYDGKRDGQLRFFDARPDDFWHVTWAFELEPVDTRTTRLHVRVRVALGPHRVSEPGRLAAARVIHHIMEVAQLRHLKSRVERHEEAQRAS
ncbi:MAG: hypothetical protein JO194_03260 [Candidatus Eremiobacteraeota bacterium]|nr:hypothetical protein [Candidatus Eremiobacteraeota bacterium]